MSVRRLAAPFSLLSAARVGRYRQGQQTSLVDSSNKQLQERLFCCQLGGMQRSGGANFAGAVADDILGALTHAELTFIAARLTYILPLC